LINVSFFAGKPNYFIDVPGTGHLASFNGVLGITLDKTESFAFLSSADGKKIRKMILATATVGSEITGKFR